MTHHIATIETRTGTVLGVGPCRSTGYLTREAFKRGWNWQAGKFFTKLKENVRTYQITPTAAQIIHALDDAPMTSKALAVRIFPTSTSNAMQVRAYVTTVTKECKKLAAMGVVSTIVRGALGKWTLNK